MTGISGSLLDAGEIGVKMASSHSSDALFSLSITRSRFTDLKFSKLFGKIFFLKKSCNDEKKSGKERERKFDGVDNLRPGR